MLAAQRQGKYLPLHDALMRLREEVNETVLRREAERMGLDWPRLRREMDDPAIARKIEANLGLARALDIQGTPALVIGDSIVPGAMDLAQLEAAIAAIR
jgi:protein-disulfide isomerase